MVRSVSTRDRGPCDSPMRLKDRDWTYATVRRFTQRIPWFEQLR